MYQQQGPQLQGILLITPNTSPPPLKKRVAVTFCVIKIASLMEVTMILNQGVLTSLSTDKGMWS